MPREHLCDVQERTAGMNGAILERENLLAAARDAARRFGFRKIE